MSAEYQPYPITMVHPHFKASKPVPIEGTQTYGLNGEITGQAYRGTPELFPPVTAGNEQEEERLKADGYQRAGQVDPAAWVRAHADAPPADYKPQAYPMWKDGVLIRTAQEDPDASPEALAPQPEPVPAPPPVGATNETENLRAQMAQMQDVMQQMSDALKTSQAQAERLAEEKDAALAKRPPGRPKKATSTEAHA